MCDNVKFNASVNVPESVGYAEVAADSVVCVGTTTDGNEMITMVFLNNYPIVKSDSGVLDVDSIEKRRVASVTIGKGQAKRFYNSLKQIFEEE